MEKIKRNIEKSKIFIPLKFENKYKDFFKEDYDDFLNSCKKRLKKAIKVNTIKYKKDIKENTYFKNNGILLKKIEYIPQAYFIESKVQALGNTIEQNLGYFQMQEVSSMLPAHILNAKEDELILDMCAAPGNKTFIIAESMQNKGLVIANDIDKKRLQVLKYNLKRLGVTNTIITNLDATKIKNIKFDRILLDAPCSCEGTIRKKPKVLKTWSNKLVLNKAKLQKELINTAFSLLKKNGTLVYSTCTIAIEENEEVINDLLIKNKNASVEEIDLDQNKIKYDKGIIEYQNKKYNTNIKKAIRINPHKTDLEAFFICKIKKI